VGGPLNGKHTVVGLGVLGALGLAGSIFSTADTAIALFTLLGALGGFMAGKLNNDAH